MGVLGKDLFDIERPRAHVKVQFGQNAYWVEYDPTPHPYGEVLTELLNCDAAPYEHTLAVLEQAIKEKDAQAAPQAFMNAVRELSSLPCFRLFLSDVRRLNVSPVEEFAVGEARTGRPAGRWAPPRASGPRCSTMKFGASTSEPTKNTLPEGKRAHEQAGLSGMGG